MAPNLQLALGTFSTMSSTAGPRICQIGKSVYRVCLKIIIRAPNSTDLRNMYSFKVKMSSRNVRYTGSCAYNFHCDIQRTFEVLK